jgi:hypothetical protein
LPHLWPTGSSSGQPPSITARYFSSCPSDSTSRWTPCPPENCRLLASGPPWLVSGFRFRARLSFSIPFTFSGPRGITPAFGYSAPHPSARETSTLLSNALLSAPYDPLRRPAWPSPCRRRWRCDLHRHRASRNDADHISCMPCSLPRRTEQVHASVSSLFARPSPVNRRVGIHNFTFEACSSFTRVTACRIARPPNGGLLSRGSGPTGCPIKPLGSYHANRHLHRWILPPQVICAALRRAVNQRVVVFL